ncbi:unnamed protein product, partial [Amoebophrya sp. A25]|eukprot:GSA25T00009458001.1
MRYKVCEDDASSPWDLQLVTNGGTHNSSTVLFPKDSIGAIENTREDIQISRGDNVVETSKAVVPDRAISFEEWQVRALAIQTPMTSFARRLTLLAGAFVAYAKDVNQQAQQEVDDKAVPKGDTVVLLSPSEVAQFVLRFGVILHDGDE